MPGPTAWPALGTTIAYSADGVSYTTIGQVTQISKAGGGEVGERDTTNLSSTAKTVAPTLFDGQETTFDLNLDPTDSGHTTLITAAHTPPTVIPFWKVTFADTGSTTVIFNGFIKTLDGANAGGVDDNLTASITIRKAGDRTIEPVDTPVGTAYVRTITAGEKDDFDREYTKDGKFRCRLVLLACCTEDGRPEFTNLDLPAIDNLPITVLEPIVDAALKLNRIGTKDQDDLRKN
jgi:hypothetical protein